MARWFVCLLLPGLVWAQAAGGVEFFEKRIRPMLAAKCYACHNAKLTTSGLALDTREGVRKGGNRGTAVVEGDPEASLLIRAVSHEDAALKMPPSGRLTDAELADLIEWVRRGAPDPRDGVAAGAGIDMRAGRNYWAFQELRRMAPPRVRAAAWPRGEVDRFLLARLEASALHPAPAASRRDWIRRVTFDLTGLPPEAREVEAFVNDRASGAFERVVDRLLGSTHYGERWARHWLDLVRYGETRGHEFDPEIPEAWRYRDYLIRAFNSDVPYDQFVREHIAGDLHKRLTPDGAAWDSPLATGFFWLGEERNAADDVGEVRADRIDNQIDVFGKTFFGLTVACARCHDHKFDPIPTRDYYALAGVFSSTQSVLAGIDSPARQAEGEALHRRFAEANQRVEPLLDPARRAALTDWKRYALAAAGCFARNEAAKKDDPCKAEGLSEARLKAWLQSLKLAATEPDHVLHPLAALARPDKENREWPVRASGLVERLRGVTVERAGDVVFADFDGGTFAPWKAAGVAFGGAPVRSAPSNQAAGGWSGTGLASSFRAGSNRLMGTLTSPGFVVEKPYVHVRLAGSKEDTRLREPGKLTVSLMAAGRPENITAENDGMFRWKTIRPRKQMGQWVYFEIRDVSATGYVAVDRIVLSEEREPPLAAAPDARVVTILEGASSLEDLADRYVSLLAGDVADARLGTALAPGMAVEECAALVEGEARVKIESAQASRREHEKQLPESSFGLAAGEDTPHNARIHIRGSHTNPGEEVPRRFLEVLAVEPFTRGSGREELARTVTTGRAGALLARVMVNRAWSHLFGEGILRTPDNVGRMGELPTHPELLDWLAWDFQASGWSLKKLHRKLALSAAYRMSSQASARAATADPDNRLLQHMPVRRLEAEAIRDSVLAVSGSLNARAYGPSVAPHISAYQDGRGKPSASGTLDGEGRRSIYVQVRRNFITPLLVAFDYPVPVQTIGRRGVSTVPSQALMMMNNEMIAREAEKWAERMVQAEVDPAPRLDRMYAAAYGRPVTAAERVQVMRFLDEQRSRYAEPPGEARLWADVAHVIFNSKEFIFIR